MSFLDTSIVLYRKTFKRIRPLHVVIHKMMTGLLIPALEKLRRFKTIEEDPFWFRLELLTNRHEHETTQHIEQLIQPGMTVLDIGAHVGYYTRLFARWVGENGRVVAFEPHPKTADYLFRNTRFLKNVTIAQVAVSEENGTAEFYDYLMMSASGSLHYDESMRDLQKAQLNDADIAPRIEDDFPVRKYEVRTVILDEYLAGMGITQVDFIKMDVEGAEISALRGMKALLQNSPNLAMIMEYNPQALKAFGLNDPVLAVLDVMKLGFTSMQVIDEDGQLHDYTSNPDALQRHTELLMDHMGVVNLLLKK